MPETPPPALLEAIGQWRRDLAGIGGPDPLTRYEDLPDGTLDFATAHPSGLAMFLAGRPTLLSSLFRESAALSDARRRARAIRLTAATLEDEHGQSAAHLAVGMATWRDGQAETGVAAPVLLRPIRLRPRGAGHADYELELSGPVRANPGLLRLLDAAGMPLEAGELEALTVAGKGFDPWPSYRRLEEVAGRLPGFSLRHRLVVSTFVDLSATLVAELDRVSGQLEGSDVAAALAGDRAAAGRLTSAASGRGTRAADGTDDIRALPLDGDQRDVLQAVASGRSVRVEAAAGTGGTQVLAAVLAALAATGRRTLLVTGRRAEIPAVAARLAAVGLGDLVRAPQLQVPPGAPPTAPAAPSRSGATAAGDPLVRLRRQHEALHRRRQPWDVSALDAMHELTRLTAGENPPRTAVRLPEDVLRRLDQEGRQQAAADLREAADLGAFEPGAGEAPWHAATLSAGEEAAAALVSARRLATRLLPALVEHANRLAQDAGLAAPATVRECGRQIDLLVGVRTTLDVFTPAVYERPVGEMVAATAPSRWRAERGVSIGLWERRRWVRQARDLVRPGCSPRDLHAALAEAEEQRAEWQRQSSGGGWPTVPAGLPAADQAYAEVLAELARLEPALAGTPDGGGLADVPLPSLRQRLDRLAGDPRASQVLPRLTEVLASLRALGLEPLVADLRERTCPADRVRAELDLAWWRSLLELLLAGDADLAGSAAGYEGVLAEVDAGERRRQASVVRQVRDALRADSALSLATSALALPYEVPATAQPDVVVLAAAHRVGAAEAALAVARARQVVVLGDPAGLPPAAVSVRPADPDRVPGDGTEPPRPSVLDLLDGALPTFRLRHQHRLPAQLASVVDLAVASPDQQRVPAPPRAVGVDLVPVQDGTGQPTADGAVESVEPEVRRVVALVHEHARSTPEQSLAVLTFSRRHARRVADAVRADLPEHPDVARWLTDGAVEPFVVTDADRGEDAVRDHVIVSVGFGRTPHGRVLHRFGRLDDAHGERRLALALSRPRRRLTVVSCPTAKDLDVERLRSGGGQALRTLLEHLEHLERLQAGPAAQPGPGGPPVDPLLADLAARLATAGAVPTAPAGAGPDLLVAPAGPVRHPVAVLSDLAPGDAEVDLLERHLVLPDRLAAFGWRVVRLAGVELFADPQACAERVLEAGS